MMQQLLEQLKIKADIVGVENNETISKYYLRLHPGERVKKIESYANEIALGLKAYSIPIIRLITEEGLVSIELLTKPQKTVNFYDIQEKLLASDLNLPVILGNLHSGDPLIADIAKMPHMLIAGTTGSGKSVMLHSIICSLIIKSNVKLILVDPKNVEFNFYQNIKQLMYPIINYSDDANDILSDLIKEMDYRFKIMAKSSVQNIDEFNSKKYKKSMLYIILIIDEFSDFMQTAGKEFQSKLSRLAQKSRACGIHIIIATQRPSADVITGVIKANFPTRVSCKVTSAINSRIILDKKGAENLIGKGDALIDSTSHDMLRFKGAYIKSDEIQEICKVNKRGKFVSFINYVRNL